MMYNSYGYLPIRRPKASDKVHFQSSNDAVTIDGFENPMSKDPSSKSFTITIHNY